jgi:hypothetical protein
MMKFSRAISQVKWLSGEKTNASQTSTLRTRTEMVFKILVFSPLNHLTRLIARENFIILICQESNKSQSYFNVTKFLEEFTQIIDFIRWQFLSLLEI